MHPKISIETYDESRRNLLEGLVNERQGSARSQRSKSRRNSRRSSRSVSRAGSPRHSQTIKERSVHGSNDLKMSKQESIKSNISRSSKKKS